MPWWKKEDEKKRDPFEDFFSGFPGFEEFGEIMEEMRKRMEEGRISMDEELLKKMKPGKPIVYGFSFKIGPKGKGVFEEFGNIEPGRRPVVKEEREPLVDVIEKRGTITILAELPGVEKKNIKLNLGDKNMVLIIDVPNKFYKEIQLPTKVKSKMGKSHYKNGVLEVELKKEKASKPKTRGPKIPVE